MNRASQQTLQDRLQRVRARVADACERCGRDPADVCILPVSKTFDAATLRAAAQLGLTRFGENRVQEVRDKAAALDDLHLDWVLIGQLQSNKAKYVARLAAEVQSLDRLQLAQALDHRLQHEGRAIDVLVQVKTSHEDAKAGLAPAQLEAFLTQLRGYDTLRVRGLMTMAAHSGDAAVVAGCFRQLRVCRDRAQASGFDLPRLSMGMSGDFHLAIAEGATEVRIGSALFGDRVGSGP